MVSAKRLWGTVLSSYLCSGVTFTAWFWNWRRYLDCWQHPAWWPSELNNYKLLAITSHTVNVLERVLLAHMKLSAKTSLDPLQVRYQRNLAVDDSIIWKLQRAFPHPAPPSTVRIAVFDFSSASSWFDNVKYRSSTRNCAVPTLVRLGHFQYNSRTCHLQKYNTAFTGCISDRQKEECRALVDDFVVVWEKSSTFKCL